MTYLYPWIRRGGVASVWLLLISLLSGPVLAETIETNLTDGGCCSHYDYWIKFPKDAVGNCALPEAGGVEVKEGSCDLLAVSKVDQKFAVPGSSNCYKIMRTYRVLNWCEYVDGAEPVVVGRDEDCDNKPGDEDIYVIVKTRYGTDPCVNDKYGYGYGYGYGYSKNYQHVWYDRDHDPHNAYPPAGTKGYKCEYESNPEGFWKEVRDITTDKKYFRDHCEMASVGYWQYTQVIKVTDEDAPSFVFKAPEPFCSYSSDQANGCPAVANLSFTVQEDCSPQDVTVKAFVDQDRDGSLDGEVSHLLTGSYPDFSLSGTFPIGKHFLRVLADDGCGNVGATQIPFEIEDCKGPSPICINGLSIKLMPVIPAADADADGDIDEGAMEIWASDFVASGISDCTGPVTYSINRQGAAADQEQGGLTLTCDDGPVVMVEIHAWDGLGNNDYCVTYVEVQRGEGLCPDPETPVAGGTDPGETESVGGDGSTGILAGRISTEYEVPVEGVMIHRRSVEDAQIVSNVLGEYLFIDAPMHAGYLIEPEADGNWLRGISISDLFKLKKYLMGVETLDSPYKMLAADLDASGTITEADLDLLWSLFLNQVTELEQTRSWAFVPRDYVFPDEANPWLEDIPTAIAIEDLDAPRTDLHFVAIKMGDLDESISPANAQARTTHGLLSLQAPDLQLAAGSVQRVAIHLPDLNRLDAYQFSLRFDPGQLEVLEISGAATTMAQIGRQWLSDGLLHLAWHRAPTGSQTNSGDQILSLTVRARSDLPLREVLQLTHRGLPAEALGRAAERYDLNLEFQPVTTAAAAFNLRQNSPNPFRTETQIHYTLPETANVQLRITDLHGRLLREIRTQGIAGDNVLTLSSADLQPGVLLYTLTAGDYSATRKMVLLK